MKDRDERWDAPLTQQQWDAAAWMFRDDYDAKLANTPVGGRA